MMRTWMAVGLAAVALVGRASADDEQGIIETVSGGSLRLAVTAQGVVEPIARVEVRSEVGGVVRACYVDVGSAVKKGDTLLQLDDREAGLQYKAARIRCDMRRDACAVAEERRRLLEGERERAGARGITRTAEAEAAERAADLASHVEVERARGEMAAAEVAVEEAELRAAAMRITSPIDGIVLSRLVEVGEIVTGAAQTAGVPPICTVVDLSRVIVRASFDEAEIARVRVGQPASFHGSAYPAQRSEGVVQFIEPAVVERAGAALFTARIAAENADRRLLPGMFVRLEIFVEERQCAALVPKMAIERKGRETAVYVVTGDGANRPPKTERRLVRLGATDGVRVEIVEGLVAGERIRINPERPR